MAFELIKVSELPELTTPSDPNVLPIQDGDYLKRISFENLKEAVTDDVADDLAAEVTAREGAVSGEATARGNADAAILADLASPYSASSTYAVGDYCTKDGQLYRCTTAISTAEAWTSGHWSAVALGDDTSDLRSAFDSYFTPTNLAKNATYTGYYFVDYTTGNNSANNSYKASSMIDITGCTKIFYSRMYCSTSFSNSNAGIAFYDNTQTFIANSGVRAVFGQTRSSYQLEVVDVPTGAKYVRLSGFKNGDIASFVPEVYEYLDYMSKIQNRLSKNEADIQTANNSINGIDLELNVETNNTVDWIAGSYWAVANGGIATGQKWGRSTASLDNTVVTIESDESYLLYLLAYQGATYIGTWFGSNFSKTYDSAYRQYSIDLTWFRKQYPNYTFKVDAYTLTDETLNINTLVQHVTIKRSNVYEQSNSILNVFGDIVRKEIWTNGVVDSDGALKSLSNYTSRLATMPFLRFLAPVTIIPKSGYLISITTYSKDKVFESQFSAWSTGWYTFADPNKLYRISINSDSQINPSDIGNYVEAVVLQGVPFSRALSEYANVKVVNHRGYNAIAPENTLPAFEMSADLGYKYVECDVLFTSDGVPVIMHDATIDRTCCSSSDGSAVTGNIAIDSVSYSDLIADYDACTPAQWATWKGVKVPTFAEFIYCCKVMNLHAWVELKYAHTYTQDEVQQLISIVKQYGMEEHVSFISFSASALALVATEWDSVELGLNGTVSDAQSLKTGKNRVFMIYDQSTDYSAAITAGFQVCVYTVNTETQLRNLSNNGFDSVLTNSLLPNAVYNVVRSKYKSSI